MIELAHGALRFDREVNMPLYACYGVAVVWLIDVDARTLTVNAEPDGAHYTSVGIVADLFAVPLGLLDAVRVDLAGLFDRTAPA